MKKVIGILNVILLLMVGGFLMTEKVNAKEGLPFIVEPILPSNQDQGIDNYISISPDSNSLKQELDFLISNKTNKKQIVDIKLFNAYTSSSGGIQYTAEGTADNVILNKQYEMKQYIQAPKQIEIRGGESKVVRLKVNISGMEGTILGAVAFQGEGESEQSNKEELSFEIKNEINKIYGIAINFPTQQNHDFKFGEPYLDPMPSYYAIRLPITHDSPMLLKDVDIDYEVNFKGKKLFFDKKEIDFAPMTKTNFAIPFDYDEIVEGEAYTIRGTLTFNEKGKSKVIEFDREFVFNNESPKNEKTNKLKTPTIKDVKGVSFLYLFLLLIPIIICLWFIRRKRKKYDNRDRE